MGILIVSWNTNDARAAIIGVQARVSSNVQELLGGEPGSASNDDALFDPFAPNFPLESLAGLGTTDVGGGTSALGRSASALIDPTASQTTNPAEFGLEVACFSNVDGIAYSVSATGDESRRLVFSSDSKIDPLPIEFNEDGTREIESQVFFSGAMLLWSLNEETLVEEMLGELYLGIRQEGEDGMLFETAVLLDSFDKTNPKPTIVGPLSFEVGGVSLLRSGADEATRKALDNLDKAGDVVVILIPFQQHTYRYTVRENEELTIAATFETLAQIRGSGVGAAVAWGREFTDLDQVIADAMDGVDGALVQKAINARIRVRDGEAPTNDEPNSGDRPAAMNLCGAMGVEPLFITSMLTLWALLPSGWSRRFV